MEPDQDQLDSVNGGRSLPGRRAQAGGGIALFIGLLLLFFFPQVPRGAGLDLHQMAKLFIAVGALLLALGTGARGQGNRMKCIAGGGTDSRLRGWRVRLGVYALPGEGGRGSCLLNS